MAGYNGYSMSNNAVNAYNNGEMPLSKWTKKAFLEQVQYEIAQDELPSTIMDDLNGMKTADLKGFLKLSSWHHTSSHYNRTNFYSVDTDYLLTHFGYEGYVLALHGDSEIIGSFGGERDQITGRYNTFTTTDGTVYPSSEVKGIKIVYLKK